MAGGGGDAPKSGGIPGWVWSIVVVCVAFGFLIFAVKYEGGKTNATDSVTNTVVARAQKALPTWMGGAAFDMQENSSGQKVLPAPTPAAGWQPSKKGRNSIPGCDNNPGKNVFHNGTLWKCD